MRYLPFGIKRKGYEGKYVPQVPRLRICESIILLPHTSSCFGAGLRTLCSERNFQCYIHKKVTVSTTGRSNFLLPVVKNFVVEGCVFYSHLEL